MLFLGFLFLLWINQPRLRKQRVDPSGTESPDLTWGFTYKTGNKIVPLFKSLQFNADLLYVPTTNPLVISVINKWEHKTQKMGVFFCPIRTQRKVAKKIWYTKYIFCRTALQLHLLQGGCSSTLTSNLYLNLTKERFHPLIMMNNSIFIGSFKSWSANTVLRAAALINEAPGLVSRT